MASKKTITIIGATGNTGLCLVKQALEAGHIVKALVRSPEKLNEFSTNENFSVTKGDVTNYNDIKASLEGSTDVLVSLGGREKGSTICSTAQPVIDKALNDTNPDMRLVVVTSMACGDSYYDVTWATRRFADLIIAPAIKDKNLQERSVIKDTTNWVIVRPAGLSDGELTGTAQGSPHAAPAAFKTIPRADVADFILKQCLSGQDEWKRYPVTVFPPQ
jgi:putative NADH-flavin reductase